jgi:superfamily II DNA or RNA helicase
MPTGTGKTVVFAHLISEAVAEWSSQGIRRRVIVLAHRDELVRQAAGKIRAVAPDLAVGVVKAGENDVTADVIVASVQTLRSPKRLSQIADVGLVIVDECHHATAESYLDVLEYYGCFRKAEGGALAVGLTATMVRSDGVALGQVWQDVVFEYGVLPAIRAGHLCDPVGYAVKVADMDMSKVRTTAGDYRESDLGDALSDSSALQVAAEKYHEYGKGQQGLAFLPTVDTAYQAAEVFNAAGVDAVAIDGTTPAEERTAVLRDYRAGNLAMLSNCMVFTEGTDLPSAAVAMLMRPTQSRGLYVQMAGRVLRPDPQRPEKVATLIDISGAAARHSLIGRATLLGAGLDPDAPDGASLTELEELVQAEEAAATGNAPPTVVKVHEAEDVVLDLFHGSRLTWRQSPGAAIPFLSIGGKANDGSALVFILPSVREPGSWDVAWMPARSTPGNRGGWVERDIPDFGYAMAWAERYAEDSGLGYAAKAQSWRKAKVVDNSPQVQLAERLGLEWSADMRKGELSDLIDVAMNGPKLDRRFGQYALAARPT